MLDKLTHGARQLGLALSPTQTEQFHLYYEELVEWNRRVNLTAITEYEEVQVKHFLDSLTLVLAFEDFPLAMGDCALLDVGTGPGMPGIPLKVLFPEMRLMLLDSVAKKTAFLTHLVECLRLDNVQVLTGRAEDVAHQPAYREEFDVVVSRALSKLPTLAELTLPFCRQGGLFIAQKKGPVDEELIQAQRAIGTLGGRVKAVKKVDLELLEDRVLVIVEKVSPTPERYPRRAGVPAQRPL